MKDNEILIEFREFVEKNPTKIFGIASDSNFYGYCLGLAEIVEDDFIWLEKSDFTSDSINIQYDFDSQGYGNSIAVFALNKDIDVFKVQNVETSIDCDNTNKVVKTPTRLYNQLDALNFLNTFDTDGEFVLFEEERSNLR
jgi:hypothetical protein